MWRLLHLVQAETSAAWLLHLSKIGTDQDPAFSTLVSVSFKPGPIARGTLWTLIRDHKDWVCKHQGCTDKKKAIYQQAERQCLLETFLSLSQLFASASQLPREEIDNHDQEFNEEQHDIVSGNTADNCFRMLRIGYRFNASANASGINRILRWLTDELATGTTPKGPSGTECWDVLSQYPENPESDWDTEMSSLI
ncbi:hypothetical protein CHUAL_009248 [Chamberlinius hualienensis]